VTSQPPPSFSDRLDQCYNYEKKYIDDRWPRRGVSGAVVVEEGSMGGGTGNSGTRVVGRAEVTARVACTGLCAPGARDPERDPEGSLGPGLAQLDPTR